MTNIRPMSARERELMLAITATCWAINEQTNHAADCDVSGHTGRVYVYVYRDKSEAFVRLYHNHDPNDTVSFTDLYPDNTERLTRTLEKLTEFLPVHSMNEVLNLITA